MSQFSPIDRLWITLLKVSTCPTFFPLLRMLKADISAVWNEVLQSVKVSVSGPAYQTWISQTHLVSLKKTDTTRYIAEVGCETAMVKQYVQDRYFGLLQDALIRSLGFPCDLTFVIKGNQEKVSLNSPLTSAPLFEERDTSEEVMNRLIKANIRPNFTFENFAVSGSNQLAWAAAEAVALTPGAAYNPLFIWGGVGVGKTHLMHAVGINIFKKNLDAKVLAVTGEGFTNDIVSGIRNKNTQMVREKYRRLDALFVDDIQFIAGKDTAQEEFFHTFNAVISAGGQIILTSDRPPTEIKKLEDRLRSRFEAGLIVDISPPDFELRCAIIQIKSQQKGLEIDTSLIHLIAGNLDSARQVEGYLTRLTSEVKLRNAQIDEELVKRLLKKGEGDELNVTQKVYSTDKVIDAVCKHYSVSKRAILGKERSKMIAYPRQILMYILRIEMKIPYEELGQILGGRDHSTIMHGVEKITELLSKDADTRADIERIRSLV